MTVPDLMQRYPACPRTLDAAAGFAVLSPYTGKEVDPADEE
jgi:hypothetical protein